MKRYVLTSPANVLTTQHPSGKINIPKNIYFVRHRLFKQRLPLLHLRRNTNSYFRRHTPPHGELKPNSIFRILRYTPSYTRNLLTLPSNLQRNLFR